ncbi:hypothetical protein [Hanstruepera marina]|uniref:hypothetical protein n=1 Tax=Hanstruepera marina TaxID=2873265 RepID=UPI001CA67C37|nr:hypothetical protein [Hanstruepera marina]
MTATLFSEIIQDPQKITSEYTDELSDIISQFPYFQSARAIYLKALKNKQSVKYNQELKTTAAYTTDRSILFDFITSEEFIQNEISQFIKQNTENVRDLDVTIEDISVNKSVQIDDALKEQIKDTQNVLDPELFQPKVERTKIANFKLDTEAKIEESSESEKTEANIPEVVLNLGAPLQFSHDEKHSFNEWLKLTSFKPIDREIQKEPEEKAHIKVTEVNLASNSRDKKFELIDSFLKKTPKLKPTKTAAKNINLAEEQMIQPEALMTETLARIYVEQKNYKKAIQSYKILSLKYPEKSGFFADQIKAVEQLQEQNNIE